MPEKYDIIFSRHFVNPSVMSKKFPEHHPQYHTASPSSGMALKTMPCTCSANALAVFINRVAHVNLESVLWRKNKSPFSVAERTISTLHPIQSQQTTHYKTAVIIPCTEDRLEGSIPFDYTSSHGSPASSKSRRRPLQFATLESLHEGDWEIIDLAQKDTSTAGNLSPKIVTYKVAEDEAGGSTMSHLQTSHVHQGEAPVLELTPETIDVLAVESLEDNPHASLYANRLPRDANKRRSGLTFHHGSAPRVSTPIAREDKKLATIITKSPVPKLAYIGHHKHSIVEREPWQIQKAALKEKFKEGWNPRKRLSPDALAGIRAIHAQFPEQYTTSVLAEKFEVSPEAIRRILKSRWTPKEEEALDRQRRWFLRGQKVWGRYAELGLKPPARWRKLGIGKRDDLASDRQVRSRADRNITMRSAEETVRELGESFLGTSANMAERIL